MFLNFCASPAKYMPGRMLIRINLVAFPVVLFQGADWTQGTAGLTSLSNPYLKGNYDDVDIVTE